MKSLIIGAAGFVGGYLVDELAKSGYEITATKLPNETIESKNIKVIDLDILDPEAVRTVVGQEQPDAIYHLAAQSSVALSWEQPALTVEVNIKGAVNLLEALRTIEGGLPYKGRLLLIGSGEEYGKVSEADNPINEHAPVQPKNIYAATKACQNMLGRIYAEAYGLDIVMARAFNHIGPGQSTAFVVSDFCRQAAQIEAGMREPVIYTGNLEVKRDFTDVRDVVKAYAALMEKGKKGSTYNVGSGKATSISEILETVIKASTAKIETKIDEKKFRPSDVPIVEADITALTDCTGWQPEIELKTSIADTLQYWRDSVSGERTSKNH